MDAVKVVGSRIVNQEILGGMSGRNSRQAIADNLDDTRQWVDPNGYLLSDRVWASRESDRKAIDGILRAGLVNATSGQGIARQLVQHLAPRAPGAPGGSGLYGARRLARTEMTRAYGQGTIAAAKLNPLVQGVKWALSGSHKEADDCDNKASNSSTGLPRGVYKPDEVPQYPSHPHCLCCLSPYVPDDIDAIIAKLQQQYALGEYAPERFGAPAFPTPTLPVSVPATAPAWVSDAQYIGQMVRNRYAQTGVVDEALVRQAGSLVRQQIGAGDVAQLRDELDAALAELRTVRLKKYSEEWKTSMRRADKDAHFIVEDELKAKVETLRERMAAEDYATKVREALGKVRPMGDQSTGVHSFAPRSSKELKEMMDAAKGNFPKDWWDASTAHGEISTRQVARGYYRNQGGGDAHIMVSGSGNGAVDTMTHEITHRMEIEVPFVRDAEKAFYERRTAGESLQKMKKLFPNNGYGPSEVTRIDQFSEAYSGKDYYGSAYEVMSMGVEDVYRAGGLPRWITKDEDYLDFVLGVLAVG